MINPIGTEFEMTIGGVVHHCMVTEVSFGVSASIYFQEPIELDMRILMWPVPEISVKSDVNKSEKSLAQKNQDFPLQKLIEGENV